MFLVKDQMGREVKLDAVPQRVVSLVPSQTELLVDLGLEAQIVGVTKFCVHPEYLRKDKTIVGGTKQINYNKIKSLRPDLVICNKEENTKEMVMALEEIAPVWISDIVTIEENNDMILRLGKLFGVVKKAKEIVSSIEKERAFFLENIENRKWKKVLYLIWKNPYMAAGKKTFIDTILELNKFENVIDQNRYPEIDNTQFESADCILLSSEPFPFKESHVVDLKNALNKKVRLVDGEYFSWYGSRLLKAFTYFKTL